MPFGITLVHPNAFVIMTSYCPDGTTLALQVVTIVVELMKVVLKGT
jgi:hypothetical protein